MGIKPFFINTGVTLEYGPNQESNNTLFTVNSIEDERALVCSTDRVDCCTDGFNIAGNWFLPNGSKISPTTNYNTQFLFIIQGNQTVGLNFTNNPEFPSGIYHCEMMDRENITHHLYAGIYPEDEGIHALSTIDSQTCMANVHIHIFIHELNI